MGVATRMLEAHPQTSDEFGTAELATCIEACFECAQACTACADACLGEPSVADLVACVRSDLDCADVCETTGRVLSRRTAPDQRVVRALLDACAAACERCGDECAAHADHHDHCRTCAEACRRCERACRDLLAAMR